MSRVEKNETPDASAAAPVVRLREALRRARIESAERTGVIVDLKDAEIARLELLNEALDPVFADVPEQVDLFDRGVSQGAGAPRLWIDAVAHVAMARDKRTYRFVQDTRFGRKVLAESAEIPPMAQAVTHYVARRLIERERALAGDCSASAAGLAAERPSRARRRARALGIFLLGMACGVAGLFLAAYVASGVPVR